MNSLFNHKIFIVDRYYDQDIGIHEFAHGLHLVGAATAIPSFDDRLQATYHKAISRGLWYGTYAAKNHKEYFAEGVTTYFNVNRCSTTGEPDGLQNHVCTRGALIEYDPSLYHLLKEIFPCGNQLVDRCDNDQDSAMRQNMRTMVNGYCETF